MTLRAFGVCLGCDRADLEPDESYCVACELHIGDEQCGACGEDRSSLEGCVCDLGWHEGQDWSRRNAA